MIPDFVVIGNSRPESYFMRRCLGPKTASYLILCASLALASETIQGRFAQGFAQEYDASRDADRTTDDASAWRQAETMPEDGPGSHAAGQFSIRDSAGFSQFNPIPQEPAEHSLGPASGYSDFGEQTTLSSPAYFDRFSGMLPSSEHDDVTSNWEHTIHRQDANSPLSESEYLGRPFGYQNAIWDSENPAPSRPGFFYLRRASMVGPDTSIGLGGVGRAAFQNDERIRWTGFEDTFLAEADLAAQILHEGSFCDVVLTGEFFLNQPLDRNSLDRAQLRSYHANLEPDPFEIWQLNVALQRGDWKLSIGKQVTPFGRYYFPTFSNSRLDAPFIRTESINWVETGLFLKYTPSIFELDIGFANGTPNLDTNSSKAGIARLGILTDWFAAGISTKFQDGIGSDEQKINDAQSGIDALLRAGPFDLSGEFIYDEYGLRQNFDPNQIFWGRSIYYRDLFTSPGRAIHGFGQYVNLGYGNEWLRLDLNYGEFYPEQIGNLYHDGTIRRGMGKGTIRFGRHFEWFSVLIYENERPVEDFRAEYSGFAMLHGMQFVF